ncbi:1994_t:CDS:1, partial [Diversispora eburnea]
TLRSMLKGAKQEGIGVDILLLLKEEVGLPCSDSDSSSPPSGEEGGEQDKRNGTTRDGLGRAPFGLA